MQGSRGLFLSFFSNLHLPLKMDSVRTFSETQTLYNTSLLFYCESHHSTAERSNLIGQKVFGVTAAQGYLPVCINALLEEAYIEDTSGL